MSPGICLSRPPTLTWGRAVGETTTSQGEKAGSCTQSRKVAVLSVLLLVAAELAAINGGAALLLLPPSARADDMGGQRAGLGGVDAGDHCSAVWQWCGWRGGR